MQLMKVYLIGDGGVGKSAVVKRIMHDVFSEEYDPTFDDCALVHRIVDDIEVQIDILDASGPEEYCALRSSHIRACEAYLLVYDITSRTSFDEVEKLREMIAQAKDADPENLPIVLLGNKCDLDDMREVEKSEGQNYAKDTQHPFFETSAKLGTNVEAALQELIRSWRRFSLSTKAIPPKVSKSKCKLM